MKEKDTKVIVEIKILWYKLLMFINNGEEFKIRFECSFNKVIGNVSLISLHGMCCVLLHHADSSNVFGTSHSYKKENILYLF